MRGKVPCRSAAGRAGGITPAYAGKRTKQNTNSQGGKDHPRVCGEKAAIAGLLPSLLGSPPRMRGKDVIEHLDFFIHRITPAYAGKSLPPQGQRWCSRDHPRVCGEKAGTDRPRIRDIGSPPRMRGKAPVGGRRWVSLGITPAYAGKRTQRAVWTPCGWDHPRVCGEKIPLQW